MRFSNIFKRKGAWLTGALLVGCVVATNFACSEPSALETQLDQPQTPRPTLSPAEQRMRQQAELRGQKEQKQREWRAQSDMKAVKVRLRLPSVSLGEVRRIATWTSDKSASELGFSPNGQLLAAGARYETSGVEVRLVSSGKKQVFLPYSGWFAWSPDSRFLAVESSGVNIWDIATGRVTHNLSDNSGFFPTRDGKKAGVFGPLLYSDDGHRIATLGEDPNSKWKQDDGPQTEAAFARAMALKTWDARSGKRLSVEVGPSSGSFFPRSLVPLSKKSSAHFAFWSSNASASSRSRPFVYVHAPSGYYDALFELEHRPDENFVEIRLKPGLSMFAVSQNGWVYAWPDGGTVNIGRSRDEKLLLKLTFDNPISAVALSSDARQLAVSSQSSRIKTFADGRTMPLVVSKVEIYDLATHKQT